MNMAGALSAWPDIRGRLSTGESPPILTRSQAIRPEKEVLLHVVVLETAAEKTSFYSPPMAGTLPSRNRTFIGSRA